MLINIILVAILFAVFGGIAHRIMGGGGSPLHLIFVGFCGYMLSQALRDIFDWNSIGLIKVLLLDIACSCFTVWGLGKIQVWLIVRKKRSG